MNPPSKSAVKKAVIYCRVSSDRQVKEGDGLRSQETRCNDYARSKGYQVIKVFKDKGVSGGLNPDKRPAFNDLFAFLDTQKDKYIILVDNVDRLTRSTESYVQITAFIQARGAVIDCPTHNFGDKPEEKFLTDIMVSTASYQREANKAQVKNRQKSRLLNGYWTHGKPAGYQYVSDTGGGKILVRDEPKATLITEALEGFASGRFDNQNKVAAFLTNSEGYISAGKVSASTANRMLKNILYTGYLQYPKWDIGLIKGKHPALISMQTYEKIQERLTGKAKAPYRKDLNIDFPLRGFVLCSSCKEPLTASWCSGRNKKYPYYHCKTKGCKLHSKGIGKETIESDFEELLKGIKPSEEVLELTKQIIKDTWKEKKANQAGNQVKLDKKVKELGCKIAGFMDRLLETEDKDMIRHYEGHIKELNYKYDLISAQAKQSYKIDTSYESAVGTVFDFIGNPYSIWSNGDLEEKRLVMNLTFTKKLIYENRRGFGTVGKALPFTVLEDISKGKSKMVEGVGFEPTYAYAGGVTVRCL